MMLIRESNVGVGMSNHLALALKNMHTFYVSIFIYISSLPELHEISCREN